MSESTQRSSGRWRAAGLRFGQVAGTFVAFVLLNEFSVRFVVERGVSIFYPVAAVNVLAVMEFGVWGAIGVFIGKVATPWPADETLVQVIGSGALNVLFGAIPAVVFRLRRLHSDLRDGKSLLAFLVFGAILNSAIGAVIGNLFLVPRPPGHLVSATGLGMWWLSDFSATLVLAIPVLAFASPAFARMRGEIPQRGSRTIANAVQVTAVVVLLGWLSSSLIGNWLVRRLETTGLESQRSWAAAASLLNEVERDIVDARAVALEAEGAGGARSSTRLAELRRTTGNAIRELTPQMALLPANDRILFDDVSRSTLAFLEDPLGSGVEANDLDRSIVILRNGIDAATARSWNDYRRRRDRIDLVSFMTEQLVLLVFVLMSMHLILRITRPLGRMQSQVARMRRGASYDHSRVDTEFVGLERLSLVLEETSRALEEHQERLRVQTKKALAASKAKSDFLAKMSHELRTPLNSIIGFSDLLREHERPLTPEKRTAFLDNISNSGHRLLKMINDLLDIAKIESGKLRLHFADTDLRLLVQSSVSSTESLFARKSQKVELDLGDEPLVARVDTGRIEQVFINLLSNATKFSPPGMTITVRARRVDSYCQVAFEDRGVGIPREKQDVVFEEFEQIGSLEQKSEGTGLGLALVRRFVEAHGGTVEVASEPGVGSTFTVMFPVWEQENGEGA